MISFRPHTFCIKRTTGGGVNSDGEPVKATETWGDPVECRYVTGGRENLRFLPSGEHIVYDYVVYCNISEDLTGKIIQLYNEGNLIDEKPVRGCRLGQLNTILYL